VGSESKYFSLFEALRRHPVQSYSDELALPASNNGKGSQRVFRRQATTLCDSDGDRQGVLVIYKDVTTIKHIDRVKDEFLSGVTHELRSPLASIKGFAETLKRSPQMPLETRSEFISIICEESARLQDLIEELLAVRRAEAQGGPPQLSPYDLKVLVESMVRGSRSILFAKNISVQVQWSGLRDRRLEGNISQMSRALRNLLANAVKYSPEGGEIRIHGHGERDRVWLEVTDQGTGIADKDLPYIFERFYRGSSKGRQKGTGLGLTLVKHIVEIHGGHLGVRSDVGAGTTFRLELPRTDSEMPSSTAETAGEEKSTPPTP
jgi:signal transduction histidine kinase